MGYQTSTDQSNSDKRLLVAGSKNVMIDSQKKVRSRPGYTRLGASNSAETPVRNAWTWDTSLGQHLPQRQYDDELEVYLGTVDTVVIDAWTRVSSGWSTTKMLRSITQKNAGGAWWDDTEKIDLQIMVNGDDNMYEWGGGVAVVDSVTAVTITKKGTNTWAQNHFYTTRNLVVTCVRTGTDYTYTGGMGTLTLTGIADTTGLIAGDILVQKIVTTTDKPVANRLNYTIYNFENQICLGSETDDLFYVSSNSVYTTFTPSSPRLFGEGFKLTLDAPTRAINAIGKNLLAFSGRSSIFKVVFEQLAVGSTLAETAKIKKLDTGLDQGALSHECVLPIGDSLAYLSNEVALRIISNPEELIGIDPKTFSNPIKPDFDAEDWTNAFMYWYKNVIFVSAPVNSRTYMLNFMEDADGKLFRFWNPPQTLPFGPFSTIDTGDGQVLHGHSDLSPESYLMFDGLSDGQYDDMDPADKISIDARAIFAYNSYGKKGDLKNFDEYFAYGDINNNTTDLSLVLNYDFAGETQVIEETIDGSDEDILEGKIGINSLAQTSLGDSPLGGLLLPPDDARKFRIVFEEAKEDFYELQAGFMTNERDRYWSIIAHGCNAQLSKRRNVDIRK